MGACGPESAEKNRPRVLEGGGGGAGVEEDQSQAVASPATVDKKAILRLPAKELRKPRAAPRPAPPRRLQLEPTDLPNTSEGPGDGNISMESRAQTKTSLQAAVWAKKRKEQVEKKSGRRRRKSRLRSAIS